MSHLFPNVAVIGSKVVAHLLTTKTRSIKTSKSAARNFRVVAVLSGGPAAAHFSILTIWCLCLTPGARLSSRHKIFQQTYYRSRRQYKCFCRCRRCSPYFRGISQYHWTPQKMISLFRPNKTWRTVFPLLPTRSHGFSSLSLPSLFCRRCRHYEHNACLCNRTNQRNRT